MTLGENDQSVGGDIYGLELLTPVIGLRVPVEVQARHASGDIVFEIKHPLAIDLSVSHGMTGGPLLHELRKHPCLISVLPLRRHLLEDAVPHRAPPPIGDYSLLIDFHVFGTDCV